MCEYCDEEYHAKKIYLENEYCHGDGAWVDGNQMEVGISHETAYFKINYCPMCGRNIKEQSNETQRHN
ncbi:hypothetical protein [Vagococcus fluvialis]|uniref:hypothetical protein n=1 Tax=Vagococcus fluvialis TaxID=2738 RepID=UPI001D0BB950|nr:hypothetical protein [Vagococcus fluvialis]UDM74973.1 hypothetical protein K5K99_05200 [Vagococcus fluvialis]